LTTLKEEKKSDPRIGGGKKKGEGVQSDNNGKGNRKKRPWGGNSLLSRNAPWRWGRDQGIINSGSRRGGKEGGEEKAEVRRRKRVAFGRSRGCGLTRKESEDV